jgi:hypothetical protein
MDNQHRQIKGYRDLSQAEIDVMNEVKTKAAEVGALVEKLRGMVGIPGSAAAIDQRWISIGATHLQQGFMALTRGVTRPDFF